MTSKEKLENICVVLGACALQFRKYQRLHEAKPFSEANAIKVRANQAFADMCEGAMSMYGGVQLSAADVDVEDIVAVVAAADGVELLDQDVFDEANAIIDDVEWEE